jgi:RNA polymerase sigma-70 factor, ECF subfamily
MAGEGVLSRTRQAGGDVRFAEFYDRHYFPVLGYVHRRVSSPEDAEEIVNTVFQVAWRKFEKLPGEPRNRQWLLLTARQTIANQSRGVERWRRLIERLSAHHIQADEEFEFDDVPSPDPMVIRAFQTLSRAYQEVLALAIWDGVSYEEGGAVLDCSPNAFGVRLNRARAAYRAALERERAVGVSAGAPAVSAGAPVLSGGAPSGRSSSSTTVAEPFCSGLAGGPAADGTTVCLEEVEPRSACGRTTDGPSSGGGHLGDE